MEREIKEYHILSWGGGTQSTALMLKFLNKEVKDKNGDPVVLDYIFFADTNNESEMTYQQIHKVKKFVEEKYGKEIVITKRNKELLPDNEAIRLIESGDLKNYRTSGYADLFQSHVLFFKGTLKSVDVMPFWTRDKRNGKLGKTSTKACTIEYKINQVMREFRLREGIKRIDAFKYKLHVYIGFSVDEFQRSKPSFFSHTENKFPLIEMNMDKDDCINYVEQEMGFKPISSVCNMCYANDIDRVYNIFKNDPKGWEKLLILDEAMRHKPTDHKMKSDVFMFHWQAQDNIRLSDIDFEDYYRNYKNKKQSRTLFDLEAEMACVGGCFI